MHVTCGPPHVEALPGSPSPAESREPLHSMHSVRGNITRHGGNPGGGVLPKGVYKGKPNYYFNTEGERFHSSKCVLLAHPAGLVVV